MSLTHSLFLSLSQILHGADATMKNQEGQTPLDLSTVSLIHCVSWIAVPVLSQGDDVKALLRDAMIPDISMSLLLKASKVDIANKGLTAAGASLLNSELPLGFRGDGGQQGTSVPSTAPEGTARSGAAGTGDGSDQCFQKKTGESVYVPTSISLLHTHTHTYTYPHVTSLSGQPSWENMTVNSFLEELKLEHLLDVFEKEQVLHYSGIFVAFYFCLRSTNFYTTNFGRVICNTKFKPLTGLLDQTTKIRHEYNLLYYQLNVTAEFIITCHILLQITMDILLEMTGEDLLSIGITQFGVRHRIVKKIKEVVQGNNNGEGAHC